MEFLTSETETENKKDIHGSHVGTRSETKGQDSICKSDRTTKRLNNPYIHNQIDNLMLGLFQHLSP